jgi:hypothetical protein
MFPIFKTYTHVLDVLIPTLRGSTIMLFEIDWSRGVSNEGVDIVWNEYCSKKCLNDNHNSCDG